MGAVTSYHEQYMPVLRQEPYSFAAGTERYDDPQTFRILSVQGAVDSCNWWELEALKLKSEI